ncbi:MAG: universal stress protein [Actinobacteria bacterium]|nr:universal stress protein [Actinomycetota bacterium]
MTVTTILVAHDGSDHAAQALDWAAGLAGQVGARLVVVRSWSPLDDLAKHRDHADFHEMHDEALAELREWCAGAVAAGVEVEPRVVEDLPVPGIVTAARDCSADLIVCGTRGRGAVKGLVLGSVARDLPMKAHLPVTIVPAR